MKPIRFHFSNLASHGIAPFEAEEAFYDGWDRRRRDGKFYEVLGRDSSGRYIQLVVEVLPDVIRVFHGRDMTATERSRYKRK